MYFLALLRKKIWKTFVTLTVIVPVINVSVDAVDPVCHFEDLTINEIESCVEWILEIGFGNPDAIQETDDHDQSTHKPGNSVVLYSDLHPAISVECAYEMTPDPPTDFHASRLLSLERSILSPPPKNG